MFRIVPARSRVWIEARSTLHPIRSETDGLEGWLELDVKAGSVGLSVTPRAHLALPVARLTSGNPLEDRELRRRIDARRYPTIEGELTKMSATADPGRYLVEGDLTFRGVTRRCTGEMAVEGVEGTVVLTGQQTFDVRDFGMEPPRILMLRVEPTVSVRVSIVGEPQA